jgi:hypothetical protein
MAESAAKEVVVAGPVASEVYGIPSLVIDEARRLRRVFP